MHKINPQIQEHLDEVLKFFARFAPLSAEEIKWLVPFFELRSFKKKEIILQQGETEQYLNLVLKGLVRKYIVAGKKETTLQLATERHLIQSEGSFHLQQPSEVVIESLEDTLLLSMRHDHVQYALDNIPGAEEIGLRLITYMFLKKNSRYYLQLKKSTRERFLDYVSQHPHMLQRVPQKILASYLNIKPETFSRLKHLVRKG
jgi:CRP-like cAMP-binding protein